MQLLEFSHTKKIMKYKHTWSSAGAALIAELGGDIVGPTVGVLLGGEPVVAAAAAAAACAALFASKLYECAISTCRILSLSSWAALILGLKYGGKYAREKQSELVQVMMSTNTSRENQNKKLHKQKGKI